MCSPSGSASGRSSVPSARTVRSAPADTYAIREPSGEGRGSTTGPAVVMRRGAPPSVRTTHRVPVSAKATSRPDVSVAYETTPDEVTWARTLRASSSGGTPPAASSAKPGARGSASSRSVPFSCSQSLLTGSVPEVPRTNSTRSPSGETVNCRGTPREKRRVRANWAGKRSASAARESAGEGESWRHHDRWKAPYQHAGACRYGARVAGWSGQWAGAAAVSAAAVSSASRSMPLCVLSGFSLMNRTAIRARNAKGAPIRNTSAVATPYACSTT